jgi:pimeloyl-ACP methyl ester carboxylesterase
LKCSNWNETDPSHGAADTRLERYRFGAKHKQCLVPGLGKPQTRTLQQLPTTRVVDLKAADGILLKASYFAAAKPGPGVLLLHHVNRQRKAWDGVAGQLAAAGINTLTLDLRGFGESGGTPCVVSLDG